jgi:hypothetical protein
MSVVPLTEAIDYWHALIVTVIPRAAAKGLSDIENLAVAARGPAVPLLGKKADPSTFTIRYAALRRPEG